MNRRTLARARFARTSAEGGGGGGGGQNEQQQQGGGQNEQQQGGGQNNQPPAEATDEDGVGLGFPKDTAVKDMNDAQRANYWRNMSKTLQKSKDAEIADLKRQISGGQQNPQQKDDKNNQQQQVPTREQIEAEIRADVSKDAAVALLRSSLHTRGKNAEEIDDLLQFVTPDAFLTAEKRIDNKKVSTYLDRVAPSGSGGGGGGLPGQGRHQQQNDDKSAVGKAEAQRRGFKPASGQSSLLPSNT